MKLKKTKLFITLFFVFTILFNSVSLAFETNTDPDLITVPNAILVETTTNSILYEKDANVVVYPASLTKVLTALIVLENCSLYDVITVNYNDIKDIPKGYSTFGLVADEQVTVEQLLHILLMHSASDAANILAVHTAGSIESFCSLMNTKATELGCENSHFVNPDGQHNESHVSTAYELYLITNEAIKNTTFTNIVKKGSYIIYPTNKHDKERIITNTNQLLDYSSNFYYSRATGVKTGFTTPAGNCLIATAKEGNSNFLLVVLGGSNDGNSKTSQRYLSATALFDYAFDNFGYSVVKPKGTYVDCVDILNAPKDNNKLILNTNTDVTAFVDLNKSYENVAYKLNLKLTLMAPIQMNDIVGTVTFNIEGQQVTAELIAGNSVEISTVNTFIIGISILAVIILIIVILIIIFKRKLS